MNGVPAPDVELGAPAVHDVFELVMREAEYPPLLVLARRGLEINAGPPGQRRNGHGFPIVGPEGELEARVLGARLPAERRRDAAELERVGLRPGGQRPCGLFRHQPHVAPADAGEFLPAVQRGPELHEPGYRTAEPGRRTGEKIGRRFARATPDADPARPAF